MDTHHDTAASRCTNILRSAAACIAVSVELPGFCVAHALIRLANGKAEPAVPFYPPAWWDGWCWRGPAATLSPLVRRTGSMLVTRPDSASSQRLVDSGIRRQQTAPCSVCRPASRPSGLFDLSGSLSFVFVSSSAPASVNQSALIQCTPRPTLCQRQPLSCLCVVSPVLSQTPSTTPSQSATSENSSQ